MCPKFFLVLACAAAVAGAQTASGPAFEVASIKPAEPITREMVISGQMHIGMKVDKAHVEIQSFTIQELVRFAYNLKPYQVEGPAWTTHLRYDISAKLPEGATMAEVRPMVARLLAERFKLVIHHETKDLPVYVLAAAKDGAKLKAAAPDKVPATPGADAPREMNVGGNGQQVNMTGGSFGNLKLVQGDDEKMKLVSDAATMTNLTDMLSRMMDRPVIDKTGLSGYYQISVDVDNQDLRNMAAGAGIVMPLRRNDGEATDPSHGSVYQSLQHLGLRLEGRKEPIDFVVVDSAEKVPVEN